MPTPLALQLWSLRDRTKTDFAGTVAEVAKIGYQGVETAGFGNLDAQGAAAALKAAGLKVAGMHVGIDALKTNLNKCISDAHLLGAKHVTCPGWPRDHFISGAACAGIGRELASIGAAFRVHGIQFAFHNHAAELAIVDGRRVFDWMLDAAAPRDLACQADVYWVQVGGKDPAEFIREQGRRIRTVHLKDEKEIGSGPVDFPSVFKALDDIGAVEWCIVEVEEYNYEPLESCRRSFEQLRAWGRA
ncbi:MAG: sugar phosphate isomerase/epimerase [Opitutaceae bacterium]|nr:sugar phosphate isomerase/epimerase [Opitutaceae bacterium]